MKYDPQEKKLHFSSEEHVRLFHDQLTELVRLAMSVVGSDEVSNIAAKNTLDFFERNSELLLVLRCMRAHMQREEAR
jgi:hypothetical protein